MYKLNDRAEKRREVYRVFQRVAKGYDKANVRISLGQQEAWKNRLVRTAVPDGIPAKELKLLHVCCGTGDIALMMAACYPGAQITGIDFSEAMLQEARKKLKGLSGVRLLNGDAEHLPFTDNSFHAAAISFGLRNTTDYRRVLREMYRVIKPGGSICILDSFLPENRFVRPFYRIYFDLLMPLIGGGIRNRKAYRLLIETTKTFLSRNELKALMRETGLKQIRTKSSMFGASVLLRGMKIRSKEES